MKKSNSLYVFILIFMGSFSNLFAMRDLECGLPSKSIGIPITQSHVTSCSGGHLVCSGLSGLFFGGLFVYCYASTVKDDIISLSELGNGFVSATATGAFAGHVAYDSFLNKKKK